MKTKREKNRRAYSKGRRFEYQAMEVLKGMGFQAIFRTPRSLGPFDIFALKAEPATKKLKEARYIQVKSCRSQLPLKSLISQKERNKLINHQSIILLNRKTFFEVWVRRLNKNWEIYRLNWKTQEFKPVGYV